MLYFYDESFYAGRVPTTGNLNEQHRRIAAALLRVADENIAPGASIRLATLENEDAVAELSQGRVIVNPADPVVFARVLVPTGGHGLRLSADTVNGSTVSVQLRLNGAVAGAVAVAMDNEVDASTFVFVAGDELSLRVVGAGDGVPFAARFTFTQRHVAV